MLGKRKNWEKKVIATLAVIVLCGNRNFPYSVEKYQVQAAERDVEEKTVEGLKYNYNVEDDYIMITGYTGEDRNLIVPDTIDGVKVKKICSEAFKDCEDLETVKLSSNIEAIEDGAFSGCNNLKTIELPEGLIKLESLSFCECDSLEKVVLPDTLKEIGHAAFAGCSSLESIELPKSLTQIDQMAFNSCSNLKDITIPDGITIIAYSAFAGS